MTTHFQIKSRRLKSSPNYFKAMHMGCTILATALMSLPKSNQMARKLTVFIGNFPLEPEGYLCLFTWENPSPKGVNVLDMGQHFLKF